MAKNVTPREELQREQIRAVAREMHQGATDSQIARECVRRGIFTKEDTDELLREALGRQTRLILHEHAMKAFCITLSDGREFRHVGDSWDECFCDVNQEGEPIMYRLCGGKIVSFSIEEVSDGDAERVKESYTRDHKAFLNWMEEHGILDPLPKRILAILCSQEFESAKRRMLRSADKKREQLN